MSMFLEYTYECSKCHKPYQTFGSDGISILYKNTFFSICPTCTDELLEALGTNRDGVYQMYTRHKELESKALIESDIKHGYRCAKCHNPFSGYQHKHTTRRGSFHTKCYGTSVMSITEEPHEDESEGKEE